MLINADIFRPGIGLKNHFALDLTLTFIENVDHIGQLYILLDSL